MDRFWSKVNKTDECWIWTAGKNQKGYGQFRLNGKTQKAHRVSYELMIGPIPDGLQIDHLCRNRACVRPDHLEAVTPRENTSRGDTGKNMLVKTHCPQGHPYDEANTYRYKSGARSCRSCHRNYERERRNRCT